MAKFDSKNIKIRGNSLNANRWLEAMPKREVENADYTFVGIGGYKEKGQSLNFETLKEVAKKVAPISAIVNTRIDQIGTFTKQARYDEDGRGFKIRPKDLDATITDKMQEDILFLEDFILNCGSTDDALRENFDTFLRKIMRDSLILDQINFEIVRGMNSKPLAFYAVDASTIRVAREDDKEDFAYAQIIDGRVVAEFEKDELVLAVRNPRTDINAYPYGFSEIETILKQLSSYLEAEDYNMRFFKQGGMTKGILNIKSDPNGVGSQSTLEDFKRQWRTQVTGQNGAWKIPVLQLPGDVEFINVAQSGGEMVFEKWVNYLINISCAVYRIDPAEINFPNNGGVGGNGGGIFEGSNQAKYKNSRDKGLYPLLQFIENIINKYIISQFNDDYVFKFVGLNEKSEEERLQIDKDRVATYITVNELRKEQGLKPLEAGDIILNPYYLQAMQAGGGGGPEFDFEDDTDSYDDEDIQDEDSNEDDVINTEDEALDNEEDVAKSEDIIIIEEI